MSTRWTHFSSSLGVAPVPVKVTVTAFDANASTFYGVARIFESGIVGGATTSTIVGAFGVFGSSAFASVDIVVAQ